MLPTVDRTTRATRLPRVPRRRWVGILTMTLLLGLAACGGTGSSGSDPAPPTTTADTGSTIADDSPGGTDVPELPEPFDGDETAFYEVPDPLPDGEAGELLRLQRLDTGPVEVGWRIMYRTEDRTGRIRAATGTVFHPAGDAPDGGWPVIADAHGTTGIVEACAPSRLGLVPADHGIESVRVMADYVGLGPAGERHPYLSKTAEANAVLDGVVAAHQLLGEDASPEWVVVGHSQGGHAALATAELAAERTPDLDLLGVVASAPGAQFTEQHGDALQLRIITSLILMGSESEWPELDPALFIAEDRFDEVEGIITEHCLDEIVPAMIPLAVSPELFDVDPLTAPETRRFMEANDPLPEPVDVPILVLAGGSDIIVVPARVDALVDRLCSIGQQTEYSVHPDADHGSLPAETADLVDSWVRDRLDGEPAGDDCP